MSIEVERVNREKALRHLITYDRLLKDLYDFVNRHPRSISTREVEKYSTLMKEIESERKNLNDFLINFPEFHQQLPEQIKKRNDAEIQATIKEAFRHS